MSYRRAAHAAWRRVGQEVVVVDLNGNRVFGLNTAGSVLWASLDESGDAVLEVSAPTKGAVRAFLADLVARGLAEEVMGPSPLPVTAGLELLAGDQPPAIAWQEGLELFAGACNPVPGQPLCDPQPGS
jgi:hypothetical protein